MVRMSAFSWTPTLAFEPSSCWGTLALCGTQVGQSFSSCGTFEKSSVIGGLRLRRWAPPRL